MSATPRVKAVAGPVIVKLEVRPDKVAVLTIDDPGATLNTLTPAFGVQLASVLERVRSDAGIVAVVLVSGKRDSFIVGANIELLTKIKFAGDAERMSREVSRGLAELGSLGKPVVAAVHGPALGGGFELALACTAIVASDDAKTTLGLPEVQLGVLPGANGLLRVAERAGLRVALDLGLTGKGVKAEKALRLGLVDEVCPHAVLVEVAAARATSLVGKPPVRSRGAGRPRLERLALEQNPLGRRLLFRKAREETRKKTRGHYPAPERILGVLERYGAKGLRAAAELEVKSFGELVVSEASRRLVEIFFATTALKKDRGIDDRSAEPLAVERVAVLGGGLMGSGIAYVTVQAGIAVRLKEKDDRAVGRAMNHVQELLDRRLTRGQISRVERDQTLGRLTGTTDYSGLRHTDVVIEAVYEDLALKRSILRDVEAHTDERAIVATSTSSLPLRKIAKGAKRPSRVVGMHYVSPVHKMPLLEVVRTDKTDPSVVATAVALGKKQGKMVIVVNDGVGFYTSRILGAYMNEASHLVAEGVRVDAIDEALVAWGWAVGPMLLLDEVGIDVAAHVGKILHEAFGDRMLAPASTDVLLKDDRKGRKNGRGFYRYDRDALKGGRRQVDPSIYRALGTPKPVELPMEDLQMRCSLQLVNEALTAFGEGVLRSPRDGDIGAIFGLGFPAFRGGPFRYVDSIGAAEILRRIRAYEDRLGPRWTPAPALVERARTGKRFYDED
jgi:3-hydroxyacyl-CoA dehydrogenase/enoyl-CoA hydratase/3-hydroxybutyryl-CoA epimerase